MPWETSQALAHTENYTHDERIGYNKALQLAAARALFEAMEMEVEQWAGKYGRIAAYERTFDKYDHLLKEGR